MSTQPVARTDEERLAQLGYQQELHRRLSGFSNFAVSFSIISILAGAITSYGIAMTAGGPLDIVLGWLFVDMKVTAGRTFLIFLVIIIVHGLLNTFGVSLVRLLSDVSAWWHLVGVAVIVAVLAFVPPQPKTNGPGFTQG